MKILLSLLSAMMIFFGCTSPFGNKKTLSSVDLEALIKKGNGYYLIDVRTPQEYQSGFIPSAINIPVDVIGEKINIADKGASIIVYCRSGHRSGIAFDTLKKMGYTNLINFGAIGKFKGGLTVP